MPNCQPPTEHRFSSTNQPKHRTPRGPSLTAFLKKCLKKNITYEDPETQKLIQGKVKDAVVWRLILNATQGENRAIEEIFNRIDGKNPEVLIDQSQHAHYTVKWEKKDAEHSDRLPTSEVSGRDT